MQNSHKTIFHFKKLRQNIHLSQKINLPAQEPAEPEPVVAAVASASPAVAEQSVAVGPAATVAVAATPPHAVAPTNSDSDYSVAVVIVVVEPAATVVVEHPVEHLVAAAAVVAARLTTDSALPLVKHQPTVDLKFPTPCLWFRLKRP